MLNEHAKYVRDTLPTRDKLEQVAEEAAELSQAALKLIRAYGLSENPTPMTGELAYDKFREEIRDLLCVLRITVSHSEWVYLTCIDTYHKYERWEDRMKRLGHNGVQSNE